MFKNYYFALSLAFAATASHADNCDELRSQIDAKIKSAGVASYSLVVVDSAASAPGKVVGSCAKGSKKIIYTQSPPASGAAASTSAGGKAGMTTAVVKAATTAAGSAPTTASVSKAKPVTKVTTQAILTECKDGSTSVGGSCKK